MSLEHKLEIILVRVYHNTLYISNESVVTRQTQLDSIIVGITLVVPCVSRRQPLSITNLFSLCAIQCLAAS